MKSAGTTPKIAPVRGRRPGQTDTRERILDAARTAFLAEGYQAVTLRSVATRAGVDVALPTYYFGSKSGLFAAAMSLTVTPGDVVQAAIVGDRAGLPERILRGMLHTWDEPASGAPLRAVAVAAAASTDPALNRLVREALGSELVEQLGDTLGGADGHQRAAVFAAQLSGVIFSRYLLQVEPLASMTPDQIVAHLLPALRATLHGPARS